jgi:hypothetical protein
MQNQRSLLWGWVVIVFSEEDEAKLNGEATKESSLLGLRFGKARSESSKSRDHHIILILLAVSCNIFHFSCFSLWRVHGGYRISGGLMKYMHSENVVVLGKVGVFLVHQLQNLPRTSRELPFDRLYPEFMNAQD